MSLFDLNIDLFTKRNLPTRKRGETHLDWLATLLHGIKTVYNDLIEYRSSTLQELSYNSQTLILQKALNDKCDPIGQGIFIDNTFDNTPQEHIFLKAENDPLYIYTKAEALPVYLFNRSEYGSDFDFIINVPAALTNKQEQIAGLANFYKLASIRFKIILY